MNELLKKAFEWLERYWHKRPTASLAPIVALIASLTHFYSPQTQKIPVVGWILSAFIGIAVLSVWFLTNRLPRVKKGNVGIVVGIACDSPEEDKQVKTDFIVKLQELIQHGEGKFQLVELPRWSLQKIGDAGVVPEYLNKTRATSFFMVSCNRNSSNCTPST